MNNRDSRNRNNYDRYRDDRRRDDRDPYYDDRYRDEPYYRNDPYYRGRPPKRRSFLSFIFSGLGILFIAIILITLFTPSDDNESAKPERIEQDTTAKANIENDEYTGDKSKSVEQDTTAKASTENDEYTGDTGLEEAEIQSTLDYYLAIYDNRNIDQLSEVVHPSSKFYNSQYTYMQSLDDRGIAVYLNDYSVQSIKYSTGNKYIALVNEDYTIDHPENGVKDLIQRSEYTLEVIDGIFYIVDMKIK